MQFSLQHEDGKEIKKLSLIRRLSSSRKRAEVKTRGVGPALTTTSWAAWCSTPGVQTGRLTGHDSFHPAARNDLRHLEEVRIAVAVMKWEKTKAKVRP